MAINLEQRILELERLVERIQAQQGKLSATIREPESPNQGDEWYNPISGLTQVFDGNTWKPKSSTALGPLKAGGTSVYVGPDEGSYYFKITATGVVYMKSGEIVATLFQNKSGTSNQVTIDANGISVRDSGGTMIFEAKPTGLFVAADKIRIGGKQPLHTTGVSAPPKVGYTLPSNVSYIPLQTADGTTYNFLVTP